MGFEVTSLKNEYLKDIRKKFREYAAKHTDNKDGGIQIYTDYRDRELSTRFLREIFKSDDPRMAFDENVSEWEWDASFYYWNDFINDLKAELTEEELEFWEENDDEVIELINEIFYWYYDREDFNNDVKVNIMVDCGNGNTDYTCDNVLNWYGNSGNGTFDNRSSILWLARTQKKVTALRKACKAVHRNDGEYIDREVQKDKFVESCVQELENLPSHMGTVTFLVEMPLFKVFDLLELQKKEYDEKGKYDPRLNKKSKSYIVLDKKTMCGLYNPWDGGGSVLEIELDKDVKLPIKYAEICVEGCKMRGYDVDEVYGLVGSCWKNTVKEIVEVA